jgi:AbrB family looped-hinge helix DNA binding protein
MAASDLVTTVSTKGQAILPKAIRDRLQWVAGTRLVVEQTADGVLLKAMTAAFAPTRPEDVFGCLPHTVSRSRWRRWKRASRPKPHAGMRAAAPAHVIGESDD